MKNYIVYDQGGKILRTGSCPDDVFFMQAGIDEFVMEGTANDVTQKIIGVGIAGRIVDKTPAEIETEKPPEIPLEKRTARITNEQLRDILKRLTVLER